jgi:serine protease Do
MNLKRSFIRISAVILALASAIVTVRFVAHAVETGPAIRIDSTPINRDPQSGNSYSTIIKKVAPSVVNIYSSRIVKQRLYRNPLMADPLFRQFFGEQDSDEGREITRRDAWLGCGIIVAPNGYILTASHVVEGADEIQVVVQNDKTKYSAKVVGMDPPTDVAILKIEGQNLPAVTLGDSEQLEVGDVVLAIGNPFGIGQTVTRGIISALGRSLAQSDSDELEPTDQRQYQNFIQTDAAINEGNSGGALVDAEGRLIGINDAIVSPSGGSAGIGFAVPINMARNVMQGFISHGRVARGYLAGVEVQDIDAGLAKGFGAPNADGALVADVAADSPAAKAGLLAGDVIVSVNGKAVTSADGLRVMVSQLPPGSPARVKIYRNGAATTIPVMLVEQREVEQDSAKPDNGNAQPAQADALDGVVVQDLTPRLRRELGARRNVVGALITDVDRASNSYDAGLRPADIILEVNHQPVASAEDAGRLCKAARSAEILVKIWRPTREGGIVRFLGVDNTRRTD